MLDPVSPPVSRAPSLCAGLTFRTRWLWWYHSSVGTTPIAVVWSSFVLCALCLVSTTVLWSSLVFRQRSSLVSNAIVWSSLVFFPPCLAQSGSAGGCRQHGHGMGDGQCQAAAGVVDRSSLHHCAAAASRGGSLLAGVQPDCPGSGNSCLMTSKTTMNHGATTELTVSRLVPVPTI